MVYGECFFCYEEVYHPEFMKPAAVRQITCNRHKETAVEKTTKSKHVLKTLPHFFHWLWNNKKTFEIRKNDRDFKVGDEIVLREYIGDEDKFTGRQIEGIITYITSYNQLDNHVVFSLEETGRAE